MHFSTRILCPALVRRVRFAALIGAAITTTGEAQQHTTQPIPDVALPKPTATLKDGFKTAQSIHEFADGRLLLVDAEAKKVVLADLAAGTVSERMSEGPEDGEFRRFGALWRWSGDSAAAIDLGKGRFTIFSPDGMPARFGRAPRLPIVRELIGTESAVGAAMPPRVAPTGPAGVAPPPRVPFPVVRVSLRTLRLDTVAQLMPGQAPRAPMTNNAVGTWTAYIGTTPLQPIDAWTALSDGTVAVVRAATYRVEWFPLVGEHEFSEPVPYMPIAVTAADREIVADSFKTAARVALRTSPLRTAILAATFKDPPTWPTTHPPFRGDVPPLVDRLDRIWLTTRCTNDERARCYDVLSRKGERVARYRLPANMRVIGFGAGTVYTAVAQKDDKDIVQRHSLP
ncbi:MAG: hypothetical protein IT353_15200 [Gemmatimonadaceae bacterium]|nr:hypothetical protein [Gemmatimonadaceae bacterium]